MDKDTIWWSLLLPANTMPCVYDVNPLRRGIANPSGLCLCFPRALSSVHLGATAARLTRPHGGAQSFDFLVVFGK